MKGHGYRYIIYSSSVIRLTKTFDELPGLNVFGPWTISSDMLFEQNYSLGQEF